VITLESSNEFPWISIRRLVKPHTNYCVDILRSTLAVSYVCWIVPIVMHYSIIKLVAVHVWNAPDPWHNWRLAGVRIAPPCQAKCKTGPWPLPSFYFGIYYSFDFSRLLFISFFGMFSGDFGFLYSRSIPDLLLFLNYW